MRLQTVSIIRQRGQLTIPDDIRNALLWASPHSAVTISVEKSDEIKITPHITTQSVDWQAVWNGIQKARIIKGKAGNLSQRINEDREQR